MNEAVPQDIAGVDALLRRASREFVYPPAPSIRAGVMARIGERRAAPPMWLPALRLGGAALALVLAIVGLALAVPQSRDALADFFGLSSVHVEVGPVLGPEPPVLSPRSFARPSNTVIAEQLAGYPLRYPTANGLRLQPDGVYIANGSATTIFVYEDEGYDLYQSKGLLGKGVDLPGSYEQLEFDGKPAYWFNEGGHIAWFEDAQGRVVIESRRTVGRGTLVWAENDVTYRLETSLPQDEAIEVARSLR